MLQHMTKYSMKFQTSVDTCVAYKNVLHNVCLDLVFSFIYLMFVFSCCML